MKKCYRRQWRIMLRRHRNLTARVQEGDHYVEQKKNTKLLYRAEAADRDDDLQKFANFLSEMIARHICELDIDSFSLPNER